VLKDPENYELYGFEELGRGDPELWRPDARFAPVNTAASPIQPYHGKMSVSFKDRDEANRILELVRYANVSAKTPHRRRVEVLLPNIRMSSKSCLPLLRWNRPFPKT
jgi:hypothetical protein